MLDLQEGFSQAGEVAFQSELAQEDVAEALARLGGHQGGQDVGDLIGGADIHQAGVICREQLRERTPARGEDGQPESHCFDQIHRLIFVLIIGGKTKHIRLAQQMPLLLPRNKPEILH